MRMNVSRLHYPVTALGPGNRAGIWVQGCTIGCAGCVSQDTWNPSGGVELTVEGILAWLTDLCSDNEVDGVTISGGEPTEQPEALRELLSGIDQLRRRGVFTGDVLCYTGREESDFHAACPWAATLVDAVIIGPFRIAEPTDLVWRGSANQRLIPLTERGIERYEHWRDATADTPSLQFAVEDGQIWMIGIPRRGDLRRLESALHRNGVELAEVSWRRR